METNTRARLFGEFNELSQRLDKLKKFILSDQFEKLDEVDRADLKRQLGHMQGYHYVLLRRTGRLCNNA